MASFLCPRCDGTWNNDSTYDDTYPQRRQVHADPLNCVIELKKKLAWDQGHIDALSGELRFHRELANAQRSAQHKE